MILAASEIKNEIDAGQLVFDPEVDEARIEASSIDLCLSNTFYIIDDVIRAQEKAGMIQILDLKNYRWGPFVDAFDQKCIVT